MVNNTEQFFWGNFLDRSYFGYQKTPSKLEEARQQH
jgi:hypothetical protein